MAMRIVYKDQCDDEYLVHCEMTKEKAHDGSIEFVSAGSKDRFLHFGQQCLIWNDETLKRIAKGGGQGGGAQGVHRQPRASC